MSGLRKLIVATVAFSCIVTPAIAATLDRGKPSNFVVWAFLTLCALIVVAQVFPLISKIMEETELTAEKARAKRQQESH